MLKRLFKRSGDAVQSTETLSFPPVMKLMARESGPYSSWIEQHRWNSANEKWCRSQMDKFSYKPSIGILMQSHNPKQEFLRESLASIFNQVYPFSELQIVDRGSSDQEIKSILQGLEKDHRVKVSFQKGKDRDLEAIARIMKKAESEWLLLMGAEDILEPNALYNMAAALQGAVDIDFVYADSDMIDDQGRRFDPQFKPVWAVGAHYPLGYYQHPILLHERLVKKLKGFEVVSKLMEAGTLLDEASNHSRFVAQASGLLYHARKTGLKNETPPAPVNNVLINENYTIQDGNPVIDELIRNRAEPKSPLNILWVVDSLDLNDETNYFLQLARWLQKSTGHSFKIVSSSDGPLRSLYEQMGPTKVTEAPSDALEQFGTQNTFDVAFVLSLKKANFPKVLSKLAIPSLWLIANRQELAEEPQQQFQSPATILVPSMRALESFRKYDSRGVLRILPAGVEFPEVKLFRQKNSPFELRKEYNVAKSAVVISIFGSIAPENGQKIFVDAAIQVLAKNPELDLQFFLVGLKPGAYAEEIKKTIEESGSSQRFQLVPESVNPEDRYPFFWISDICVSCRRDEIFPLTILEAMAFKKAVIATNTSAATAVIEDWGNGFLIPPDNVSELVLKLDEMVKKMDLTEDFGRRSHEIAMDHHHIKKSGAKLEQFLRESIVS